MKYLIRTTDVYRVKTVEEFWNTGKLNEECNVQFGEGGAGTFSDGKLNTLVKDVDDNMKEYKITDSARIIQDFTDELSNWYVRRSRERFWAKGMEQDKINAYMTLYTCLVTLAKVCAPFVPFMTEEIWEKIGHESTIANEAWPTYDEEKTVDNY